MKLHMATDGTTGSVDYAIFRCPGCDERHMVRIDGDVGVWGWNGSKEAPTFTPSILVKSGHYISGAEICWCTYNAEHPEQEAPFHCYVCHSFVTDGKIQFLSDCSHKLAGQTVDIPDWDD
jgi:hypothetical protein